MSISQISIVYDTVNNKYIAETSGGGGSTRKLLHIQDQKPSGTDGGTFSSGAWRTRTLNTILTNNITGASLSSNLITLPSGTYECEIDCPAYRIYRNKSKLRNNTASVDLLIGTSKYTPDGSNSSSRITGEFTLSQTSSINIQHRCESSRTGYGFGNYTGFAVEIYTDVRIWKV